MYVHDKPRAVLTYVRAQRCETRHLRLLEIEAEFPVAFDDPSYLERRAEAAMLLAQTAEHPAVVRAHYVMASAYLSRLYPADNDSPQPPNRLSNVAS